MLVAVIYEYRLCGCQQEGQLKMKAANWRCPKTSKNRNLITWDVFIPDDGKSGIEI